MTLPRFFLTGLLATAATVAWAHSGADAGAHHGFLAGALHPLTGLDHLVAMLAVGFWSAHTARRPRDIAAAPLAFVLLLAAGTALGTMGLAPPAVEPMIAVSLLVLGLLVASRRALGAAGAATLVGLFALFHGAAHGLELTGAAALAGMLLATAALHLAGIGLGRALAGASPWWPRLAGTATAVFGAALLLA